MTTRKAAAKGLADMNNSQKAMIHNIEAITERVCEKIGGELTPAQRKEIASSVVSKYLTSIHLMVAQHLCIPPGEAPPDGNRPRDHGGEAVQSDNLR